MTDIPEVTEAQQAASEAFFWALGGCSCSETASDEAVAAMRDQFKAALATLSDTIEKLTRENGELTEDVGYLHGNSIHHWYAKATAYGDVIMRLWGALGTAGFSPDGETSIEVRLAEALAEIASLRSQHERDEVVVEAAKVARWNALWRMSPDLRGEYVIQATHWLPVTAALSAREEAGQ